MEKMHAWMEGGAATEEEEEVWRRRKKVVGIQAALRLSAFAFSFSSIFTMLSSSQSVTLFGTLFSARYYYSSSFRFLVGVDVGACIMSLLSLILVILYSRRKGGIHASRICFLLFLHDIVVMVILMAGSSAATAIGYVGRHGQEETGWMPICDHAHIFCNRVMVSIMLSFLAFLCFFFLTLANTTMGGISSGD